MGRPPLCCVFCYAPVQRTEEGREALMDYLDFYEGKPICADCVGEIVESALQENDWHREEPGARALGAQAVKEEAI